MDLKKTCLYDKHLEHKGRMVPYAGWNMPVQYTSIIEEHMAVRNTAGLFDVSHMGEILIEGSEALNYLESITCNTVGSLKHGQIQYNALINDNGGLVDDITIYRENESSFFMVVNASNTDKAFSYIKSKAPAKDITITNKSSYYGQIALQGPVSDKIIKTLLPHNFSFPEYYHFTDTQILNIDVRLSRTGYTGEDGFEIYMAAESAPAIWTAIMNAGKDHGILPCGLGSRDALRLEARYPLYGHELGDDITPVESGIGWIVKEKEIHFPKYDHIINQKKNGSAMKVAGFIVEGQGIPREGFPVFTENESASYTVMSGAFSPVLKKSIGTVLLPSDYTGKLFVEIRGKKIPAVLHKGAFVKGTAGKKA
jgi:aminomethyltransferase